MFVFKINNDLLSMIRKIQSIVLILICLHQLQAQPLQRTAQAHRVAVPPEIDGIFNDPVWLDKTWEDGFVQYSPDENAAPSQRTVFLAAYDNDYLYFAVKAYDSEPESIVTRLSRRDNLDGDRIGIQIDSYNDQLTSFVFRLSAAGVKSDYILTDDGDVSDFSWDPVWFAATAKTSEGWNTEIKIPLSQLRFSQNTADGWGLEIERYIYRKQEMSLWQPIARDAPGWVSLYGRLQGISGLKPKRQIEILPYVVGRHNRYKKDPENPFSKGEEWKSTAGLDGKIGLTNNFTLDFTINPDFGQVEADPSQVNLTSFETYYSEKRPFFVEGKNITSFSLTPGNNGFSSDNLFYSRRIGRRPRIDPSPDYNFIDYPENTAILGALKVSGKTRNGLSVGVLENITSREKARYQTDTGIFSSPVEPLSSYFISRVQKDFNKGDQRLGAMFTATNRRINHPDMELLHHEAYTTGLDYYHSWKNRTYYANFKWYGSYVAGSPEAITRTQRSGARFFQRPDAGYVKVDSNLTSLTGHGGFISAGKSGNGHWNFIAWINWRSPGLDLNDAGYLRRADDIFQVFWVGYNVYEPTRIFRSYNFGFNQWTGWDFGGNSTYKGGNVNFNGQFKNYWNLSTGFNVEGQNTDNFMLFGGPSVKTPGDVNYWYWIGTDGRKKLWFGINQSFVRGFENGYHGSDFSVESTYKPINALNITLSGGKSLNYNNLQFIDVAEFNQQNHYILGSFIQETFYASLHINLSLSPDLTLQYYAQPFISAGRYGKFKQITDSHASNYSDRFQLYDSQMITYNQDDEVFCFDENMDGISDYQVDNPNFKYFMFRSNMVLRWEYTPGSTLFLVWSQSRDDNNNAGRFNPNDFSHMGKINPYNVFLVKFSYRFMV